MSEEINKSNTSRQGLIAGGNWIIDHTHTIDVYPAQDALANVLSTTSSNGGSPFNLLIDLARLGAPFPLEAVGLIGTDTNGDAILNLCREQGIRTDLLQRSAEAPTSFTNVMSVQSTGRRTFFHARGTNALLGPEHFDFNKSRAKLFHLGYLLLLDRLDQPGEKGGTKAAEILESAQKQGLKTSIDVVSEDSNRFAEVVIPALPFTDYCILNEFEAERTTGKTIRLNSGIEKNELLEAAQSLLDHGVKEWVIIHFPEGALARHHNGETLFQPSLNLPDGFIAGSSGAGDAFAAGLLLGLHENLPMSDCLKDGIAAAATCLSHPTTSAGVLNLMECRALTERLPFRNSLI